MTGRMARMSTTLSYQSPGGKGLKLGPALAAFETDHRAGRFESRHPGPFQINRPVGGPASIDTGQMQRFGSCSALR